MRIYLFYNIWNKAAHVPWLCEGIRNCFPQNTVIDVTFENCTDSSEKNFNEHGNLKGFQVRTQKSEKKYRWANTNDAIQRFLTSDCDLFITPQDDQKIQDRQIYQNIDKLMKEPNVGLVGMRDGVDFDNKYFSSNFSFNAPNKATFLRSGEYKQVRHVNDGPLLISRQTVNKVGLFTEDMWMHYVDTDYSYRCIEAGLNNYVLGTEVIHEKWGCRVCGDIQASEVWADSFSLHDHTEFRKKWPS